MEPRNPEEFFLKNNHVEIEILTGQFKGKYLTTVTGAVKGYFEIKIPYYKGILVPLKKDDSVRVSAFEGKHSYSFQSKIVLVKNEKFYIPIPEVSKIVKTERRKYLRIDIVIPLTAVEFNSAQLPNHGYIVNLSGGGCLAFFNQPLTPGKQYSLKFSLPNEEQTEIYALAELLRIVEEPRSIKKELFNFAHIFEFKAIDEKYRDLLVKFVLQKHVSEQRYKKENP